MGTGAQRVRQCFIVMTGGGHSRARTRNQGCARIQKFHVRVRLACIRIRPYPPLFLDLLSVSADIRPRISAISNKKFYEKLKIHNIIKQSSVY